jgi:hypothetical protein
MLATAIIIEWPMTRDFLEDVFMNQCRAFVPQHTTMTPPAICILINLIQIS